MSNPVRKLWLSMGLAVLFIVASLIFSEILAQSAAAQVITPLTLLALAFGCYCFLSCVRLVGEEYASLAWKAELIQTVVSGLVAISFASRSTWGVGIGLGIIGAVSLLPPKLIQKTQQEETKDN